MKDKEIIGDGDRFVVVTGSPAEGFEFTGPFDSYDDAAEWTAGLGEAFWIEVLHPINPADFGRDH
jgi:hypothetical protein